MHHQTTLGISTRCLPKSTIYPLMIRFAGRVNGQQPVPSAASELTSGTEQAQAAPPPAEKTPRKTIAENADPMGASSPPAPPPPTVPVHAAEAKKETPRSSPVAAREPHVSGHGVVVCSEPGRGSLVLG